MRINEIISAVAQVYDVPQERIFLKDRTQNTSDARSIAMWIGRFEGMTYPQLGQVFIRDHSTVVAAVSKINDRIKVYPHFKNHLKSVMKKVIDYDFEIPIAEEKDWTIVPDCERKQIALYQEWLKGGDNGGTRLSQKYGYSKHSVGAIIDRMMEANKKC
jgi:hypothetical protein